MKGLIQFSFCKIIDASSPKSWDRVVFEETWQEFYMQAQSFNPQQQYQTFQALLDNVPGADRLHYLTSRVAMGYLKQLNQIIPDVVNAQGKPCLPFTQFKFEIVASHVQRKDEHKVAVFFYSDPLTWIDTIGDRLLIANGDQRAALLAGETVTTELVALQPLLTIWTYQPHPFTKAD